MFLVNAGLPNINNSMMKSEDSILNIIPRPEDVGKR
jgi:hypothetical protein